MVLPARSSTVWMLSSVVRMDSTPRVFRASSCTLPLVFWYRVAARLVGTAAMSALPLATAATTSSGAPERVKAYVPSF